MHIVTEKLLSFGEKLIDVNLDISPRTKIYVDVTLPSIPLSVNNRFGTNGQICLIPNFLSYLITQIEFFVNKQLYVHILNHETTLQVTNKNDSKNEKIDDDEELSELMKKCQLKSQQVHNRQIIEITKVFEILQLQAPTYVHLNIPLNDIFSICQLRNMRTDETISILPQEIAALPPIMLRLWKK